MAVLIFSGAFPSLFPSVSPLSAQSPTNFCGGSLFSDKRMLLSLRQASILGSSTQKQSQLLATSNRICSCHASWQEAAVKFAVTMFDQQEKMASGFAKAFLLANTVMLLLPSEALAKTCEAQSSVFNMPLLSGVALIGATVGGLLARQRKEELKRVNDQLRQINAALRRQAKIESYAPNLSYVPAIKVPEHEVILDPKKEELITKLRSGKTHLRNQNLEMAFTEFAAALDLAKTLGDHVEEKKAARGLGASLQRQGKYKEAIKYHSKVLEISDRVKEDSGNTEAYGAIADCYTELGDLEQAGSFYDKYIARLQTD